MNTERLGPEVSATSIEIIWNISPFETIVDSVMEFADTVRHGIIPIRKLCLLKIYRKGKILVRERSHLIRPSEYQQITFEF